MEQQGMRPSYMPDFSKADLANRKKAFDVLYKDFIQADIDKTTSLLIEKGSIRLKRGQMTALAGSGLAAGARRAAGVLPFAGAIAGGLVAGGQAMAGDIEGAKVTAFETAAGEVPVVGDLFTADPAASGTLEGAQQTAMEVRRQEQQPKSAAAKILDDPLNELEYAGKQILGGLKTVGGAILFGF